MGHIMCLASPSINILAHNSKTKKHIKSKFTQTLPTVTVSAVLIFRSKGQRSRLQNTKNSELWRNLYVHADASESNAAGANCTQSLHHC